ncbi:MAG: glutathione S-transferase family protein [Hyphomicrobiales bacterium]
MKLLDKDDCPFCWKVRIAIAELGLDCEIVTPGANDDKSEVNRHSPQGTSPVLVDGDLGIWESAVIIEYLDDLADGRLMGKTPERRATARLYQVFSDRLTGEGLRDIVFEKRSRPEAQWDREKLARAEAVWRGHLGWLEARLGEAAFFLGEFSAAECALYPRLALAEKFGVGVDGRHPNMARWYESLHARPSITSSRPKGWA